MKNIIKNSFSINLKVMRFCRMYPPENPSWFFRFQAHLLHLLCVTPVPVLGILYLLVENNLNMDRVNYNAGFLAQTACFITKLLPFITRGAEIRKCIDYFDSPTFEIWNPKQKKIMDECLRVCRRNTYIFLICVSGAVTSWATKPFFWNGLNLPVDIWLPFNPSTNGIAVYCFVYSFMVIGVYFTSFATGVVDPLIAGLACHATTQIKILKDNLQNLNENTDEKIAKNSLKIHSGDSVLKYKIMYNKIKNCIKHHDAILSFIKGYEDCFSSVVFSQFAASVFVICFSCLQLSKVNSFEYYFVQLVTYFSVILGQIYFYCYYGTMLYEESNTLTDAIYMGQWYDYDDNSKKALLTLMERSKKPLTVTAGKILDLSLVTFTMILKRSYSLLAVLKNYQ